MLNLATMKRMTRTFSLLAKVQPKVEAEAQREGRQALRATMTFLLTAQSWQMML